MHATHPHNGHAINGDLPIPEARFTLPLPNGANGVVTPAAAPPSPNGDCGEQTAGPPSPNGEKGRDRNGRFARGNKGGPGNPFARRVGRLRSQLLNLVTEADLQEVARKLVEQARTGNLVATRLLLVYLIGRPAETVDPDRLDLEEWQLCRESPTLGAVMDGHKNKIDPSLACVTAGHLEDRTVEEMARLLERKRGPVGG